AGGADIILIPEIPYSLDSICQHIAEQQKQGKNYCLVVVAEAVKTETGEPVTNINRMGQARLGGIGQYLADEICDRSGAETRVTVLGHIQRGGTPSPIDRIIASAFGVAAVDLILEENYDRVVVWRDRSVSSIPILDAIAQYRAVNADDILVETAQSMGICLGN
ncbi:MAG: 6-phosphofructokinase, partial [Planktothrix sp.]